MMARIEDTTELRGMVEAAIGRALVVEGFSALPLPAEWNPGIVGRTDYGDGYPEMWRDAPDHRLRPHQFGSAVLNSVVGHCANRFGFTGPQILLTRGDPKEVAKLQFQMGRSRFMIACRYDIGAVVEVCILMGA